MLDLKLPEGALADRIQYFAQGIYGQPFVKIPFRNEPTRAQVKSIADSLAEYVKNQAKTEQEVEDISTDNPISLQFIVRSIKGKKSNPINVNYRVFNDDTKSELIQGTVYIFTARWCGIDQKTLETFAERLKNNK